MICILIIALSIMATPAAIDHAYEVRGMSAVGGEYLLIPFALMISLVILTTAREWDIERKAKKKIRKMEKRKEYGTRKNLRVKNVG